MIDTKPLHIRFDKIDGFIQVYDGTRHLVYLEVKNMISFTKGLDIFMGVKSGTIIMEKLKLTHMILYL